MNRSLPVYRTGKKNLKRIRHVSTTYIVQYWIMGDLFTVNKKGFTVALRRWIPMINVSVVMNKTEIFFFILYFFIFILISRFGHNVFIKREECTSSITCVVDIPKNFRNVHAKNAYLKKIIYRCTCLSIKLTGINFNFWQFCLSIFFSDIKVVFTIYILVLVLRITKKFPQLY